MRQNAEYLLVYFVVFLAFVGVSFFLADLFNRLARRVPGYKRAAVDLFTAGIFLFLVGVSLILPYFMLQSWAIPPFLTGASVPRSPSVGAGSDNDLRRAEDAVEKLRKDMIATSVISVALQRKVAEQRQVILKLLRTVRAEKRELGDTRQAALLTEPQIKALMSLLTQGAQSAANRSFLYGVLVSFPMGILSSLLATVLHRKLKEK